MQRLFATTLILLCSALLAGCKQEASVSNNASDSSPIAPIISDSAAADTPEDAILAVVNGVEIPASRIPFYTQGAALNDGNREQVINNMITSELIAQAAKKSDIVEKLRDELAIAEQTVLGRAYVTDFFERNPVNDEQIMAEYEELSQELNESKEYDAAHILVAEEAAANDLLQQIKDSPDSFAELAREHSVDTGSGQNDGKLGWVQPQALVPEFAAAMQTLGKGELSDAPVKTQFGWHIIRVDDFRDAAVPELNDELRQRITQKRQADLLTQHIEKLREEANVEIR